MKRKVILTTVSIVVLLLTVGLIEQHQIRALDSTPQPKTKSVQVSSEEEMSPEEKLVVGNTKFAFNLFQEILKQDSQENVFISPSSIAFALAMTYNGAEGKTQQEMLATLQLLGMSDAEINSANQALIQSLETVDSQVKISIANSIWARDDVAFKSPFLDTNRQFYDATVRRLDFSEPRSPEIINSWVSEKTQGKIPEVVESLQPDDTLLLINAIYFLGKWTNKFDSSQTIKQPFFLADGSTKQHPLMSNSGEYGYYENDQFQGVNIPYGQGRLSMYVFLPRPESNLKEFNQQLTPENWEEWLKQFSLRTGNIKLPRFKLEYEIGLKETLQSMGMEVAFNRFKADFSSMSEIPVAIDEVKHKTFVEVDEEGTEAAAVTSTVMARTTSISLAPPFQMRVDRPFFFAIQDNQTGTILFMGSILEPKL